MSIPNNWKCRGFLCNFSLIPAYCCLLFIGSGESSADILPPELVDNRLGFEFQFSSVLHQGEPADIAASARIGTSDPSDFGSDGEVVRISIVEDSLQRLRAPSSDWLASTVDVIDVAVAFFNVLLLYFLFRVGRRIAIADERRINTRNLRTFWLRSVIVERNFHLIVELYDQTRRSVVGLVEAKERQTGVGENLEIGHVSRLGMTFSGEFSDSFGLVVSRFLTPLQGILPECAGKVEERLERFEAVSTQFFADPDPSTRGDVENEIALGPSEIMKLLWKAEEELISLDGAAS